MLNLLRALCVLFLFVAAPVMAGFNAGFVVIAAGDETPEVGVWYPSLDDEREEKIGVFSASAARRGKAADGLFPAIVLSHGATGKYSNHHPSAAALARAGYVVIAPQHTADDKIHSRESAPAAITKRAREFQQALLAAYSHKHIGGMIDKQRTGALGYSFGGITSLMSAGATPDTREFARHCRKHGNADAGFCGGGLMVKGMRKIIAAVDWLKEKGILKPQPNGEEDSANAIVAVPPLDIRAIALVAPGGAPFTKTQLQNINAAVALFRFGDDDELKYPHHAEKLNTLMGEKVKQYKTYPGVHHYAFIAPFPQRVLETLKEEEDIAVATDPKGFNRNKFINKINADIIAFFTAYL